MYHILLLVSPSLFVESSSNGTGRSPFLLRVTGKPSQMMNWTQNGYPDFVDRGGEVSHPTAKRTDWVLFGHYTTETYPGSFTYQDNRFFRSWLNQPAFCAVFRQEFYNADKKRHPKLVNQRDYKPVLNGLESLYCSKADADYAYLDGVDLAGKGCWSPKTRSWKERLLLFIETYLELNEVAFQRVSPDLVTSR